MAGKKWCEYCRINVDYSKKAIQDHEATRLHIQNKQKAIKFQRMKIQKQKRQVQQNHAPLLGTAFIPKAKRGTQLQQQVAEYRNDVYNEGKAAIHRLIAQQTSGKYGAPIEYPQKQDLNIIQNYENAVQNESDSNQANSDSQQNIKLWKIDFCEQTKKPCFINTITSNKVYQPPIGYIMSDKQKQEWEEAKQYAQYLQFLKERQNEQAALPQWQQCEQEEDFFEANRAQDSQQQQSIRKQEQNNRQIKMETKIEDSNIKKQQKNDWRTDLQQKIVNEQVGADEVIQTFLTNKLNQCRNLKEKNDTLKQLIKRDFEIRTVTSNVQDPNIEQKPKNSINFKPRKRVKGANLIQQKDIY